jgi:hypothetical protein
VSVPTLNQAVSTLRFFFRVTLKRYELVEHTHFIHEPRKLPVVLSPEEVARLLDAAPAAMARHGVWLTGEWMDAKDITRWLNELPQAANLGDSYVVV